MNQTINEENVPFFIFLVAGEVVGFKTVYVLKSIPAFFSLFSVNSITDGRKLFLEKKRAINVHNTKTAETLLSPTAKATRDCNKIDGSAAEINSLLLAPFLNGTVPIFEEKKICRHASSSSSSIP